MEPLLYGVSWKDYRQSTKRETFPNERAENYSAKVTILWNSAKNEGISNLQDYAKETALGHALNKKGIGNIA